MSNTTETVILGDRDVTLYDLIAVARYGATVSLSPSLRKRVDDCRNLVEEFVAENQLIYGITTGVGDNVKHVIPEPAAKVYQEKLLMTHCTSVGEPLEIEAVRAIMFVMLTNMGSGYSGVRLKILEQIAALLNKGITPWAPAHGSVGYLGVESHVALVLLGKGKAYYKGQLFEGIEALKYAGLDPLSLSYKEGLCLSSGGTSATALAALSAYDAWNALCTADAVACLTLEALKGNPRAFDERVMSVKRQPRQWETAQHLRELLKDSQIIHNTEGKKLQDALSLRCIPQAHGAAAKSIMDAMEAIENELNSCDDNPVIHPSGEAMSACNADAGFVGIASDTLCIAACYLAKISERRTDRMVNGYVSGLPGFLVEDPGENSGYMIVQYSSAGMLGEMRVLAHPASIDSVPTCALQEDYVSMGYNAAAKARKVIHLLEYILGNELLTAAQALDLRPDKNNVPSTTGQEMLEAVREYAPFMKEDHYISPDMEWSFDLVHSGRIRKIAELRTGPMYRTNSVEE